MRLLVLTAWLLVPHGTLACEDWDKARDALKTLERSDPSVSAERAAKTGDSRFLSVRGYSESIPGIKNQKCAFALGRPRLIDPTFDVICNSEHGRAKDFARGYAQKYNSQMQRLLKAAGETNCES